MSAPVIILIVALIFLIISIFLFNGKGKWLILGYNSLPKEVLKKYNEKKICRAMGILFMISSIMFCIMAYLGYLVISNIISKIYMIPFALIFMIVILVAIIAIIKYINKNAKNNF